MQKIRRYVLLSLLVMMVAMAMVVAGGGKEEASVEAVGRSVSVGENWGFSWSFSEQEIIFDLTAPTTGWIAIGFNPERMMRGANYILAYVEQDQVHIRDDYGTGLTSHDADVNIGGTQDVRLISGSQTDGETTVRFALPRQSADAYDTDFIPGETYTVLLAYGGSNANNFTSMHRRRTSVEVVLD